MRMAGEEPVFRRRRVGVSHPRRSKSKTQDISEFLTTGSPSEGRDLGGIDLGGILDQPERFRR